MLRVYIGADTVPHDKTILWNVAEVFATLQPAMTEYTKSCISEIDGGEQVSDCLYRSRLGPVVSTAFLSMGCKACISAQSCSGVLNITECGSNAIMFMLANVLNAELLIDSKNPVIVRYHLPKREYSVIWDGVMCRNRVDLDDAVKGFKPCGDSGIILA